jgi:glutamate/tyrosine decarboxylase-like PLP-dependent enzyme
VLSAPEKAAIESEASLDPENWDELRALGHRMVDDALDYLQSVRERKAWQSPPEAVRERLREGAPRHGQGAEQAYRDFVDNVLPYPTGNIHPRFWGWVIGTGTPLAALTEMLAATMNPNVGGFDDAASLVEDQVLDWWKELLGYPSSASGLLVSGGSMANLVGIAVARHAEAGFDVRLHGQGGAPGPMRLYASTEVHNSVGRAMELLGLGREALHLVPADADFRIDVAALEKAIADDRRAGARPFAIVGSAGTVNTGAIDDLPALSALAARERLHFHVDGAVGALAALSPDLRDRLRGMETADSIAFDPHKWGHFPYEAGCILVRDAAKHAATFASQADYLAKAEGGIAGGGKRFADRGPQLSRGFRALKIWMVLKATGADRLGAAMRQNVAQATWLAERVRNEGALELLAPAPLNIVCFRYRGAPAAADLDALNRALVIRIQEEGIAVPSSTILGGRYAIRVCLNNHRTRRDDLELFVRETLRIGRELQSKEGHGQR